MFLCLCTLCIFRVTVDPFNVYYQNWTTVLNSHIFAFLSIPLLVGNLRVHIDNPFKAELSEDTDHSLNKAIAGSCH